MSIVKSFSFPIGEIRGDCFYIKHDSSNFTLIDCYLKDGDDSNCRKEEIIREVMRESKGRICRFISTHPDNDHILGIEDLDENWEITNFYAVDNAVPSDANDLSLEKYLELKKSHNYAIREGRRRKWLYEGDDSCAGSNIVFLWPNVSNEKFNEALKATAKGESPNDISCVIRYDAMGGGSYLWMGDMETGMQEEFYKSEKDKIHSVDVLFHPHHGRDSATPPDDLMFLLGPQIVVIGNAPSEHINYGDPDQTITQNTAGDVAFVNDSGIIHVFTANTITNPPKVLNIIALVFACLFVLFVILNIVNNSKEIHFYKKQEEKE